MTPDSHGHFRVEGRVDGRRVDFLVDTGASMMALTARDAATLGIHPAESDYTIAVSTANGTVHAAPVTLNRVEIGGITVRDVAAMVLPENALERQPARHVIPVAAAALRICQRPAGAGAII